MTSTIDIVMGGLGISDNTTSELKTFVGSCVAICLYDPETKVASMAHVMLPKNNSSKTPTNSDEIGKFADYAIETMLQKLVSKGCDIRRIKAKMAGGATIFTTESNDTLFNVGPKNIKAIKSLLTEKNIQLVAEDTGLRFGRWVRFNVKTNEMIITSSVKKNEKTI